MVHLRTLGESVVEIGKVRIGPSAPHMFAALLYLFLERGRHVSRVRLQELLFPDADDASGAHSLRQLLYRIRRAGVDVRADGTGVVVAAESVHVDYERFLTPTDADRADVSKVVAGVLPGFTPTFSKPFAEWLDLRRAELETQIRRTLTVELAQHRRAARWHAAERTARAILSLDQFNEEATFALAESMALAGSKLEAVQLLDAYIEEVGPRERDLRVPAVILRRRITERLDDAPYATSTPFVGRAEPMRVLRRLIDAARAGHGSACHVWGDAGIGKTRLVSEFARTAVLEGVCVQQMSAQPHDIRRPMGAFIDLVPNLLRVPGALGCSPEAIGFLKKLYKYDSERSATPSPDAREAELLAANITTAISELLDAITSEQPFVLILEDVQWLDSISLKVVGDLAAERKARPLLLVLTSRDVEQRDGMRHVERMASIRLHPLQPSESSVVLLDLLTRHGVEAEPALQQWFLGVAAGNPFFLHSLVLHYVATGDSGSIPEPLTALLTQRVSVLDRRASHVLAAVVILGRHSTLDSLEAILGLPTYQLIDALQSLEALGFIETSAGIVGATHALWSDIALHRTPRSVRVALHRKAGELLGAIARAQNSATALWDSAEHWLQSGDADHSVKALRACAKHALEIGRPTDAVRALGRAAELAPTEEDLAAVRRELLTAARIAGAWTTVLEVVTAIRAAGGFSIEAEPSLEGLELEALHRTGSDPAPLADRLRVYVNSAALSTEDRWHACLIMVVMAEDLLSEELAEEAFLAAQSIGSTPSTEANKLEFEIVYHASFGDVDCATDAARRLLALTRAQPNYAVACRMALTSGRALLRAGLLEGIAALEACYSTASEHRLTSLQYLTATSLSAFLFDAGRTAESMVWHDRASSGFRALGDRTKSSNFLSHCALLAMSAGDFEEARACVQLAVAELPSARVGHAGLHFRALDLRIRQVVDGYDCNDGELDELLASHFRYRGFGFHDHVMEAVWHAMERKGRRHEADELLDEYLRRHRRIRWPVTRGLSKLSATRLLMPVTYQSNAPSSAVRPSAGAEGSRSS